MFIIKELYLYRHMIFRMVQQELKSRYKGAILGFLWTFINPLLQLFIYIIVFSKIMKNDIKNYPIFLFVALIPWIFFSNSAVGGSVSVISKKELIKKIYFPRMVIPISFVTTSFVNMILSFFIIFAVLIFSGYGINIFLLKYLFIAFLNEYIFVLGISLITSSVTVYFRDMEHILNIFVMAWQYLTPIMYSDDMIPDEYIYLFKLNPMTHIIKLYRTILYYKEIPELAVVVKSIVISLFILIIGVIIFNKLQKGFAEEL